MRLDHLLSRDLGACEGAGGAHGRAPWVLSWPVGGAGRADGTGTRSLACVCWCPCAGAGGWVGGARPLSAASCACAWGVVVGGGGGMLSGSGAACPFVSCFCFLLLCGGLWGCGWVGCELYSGREYLCSLWCVFVVCLASWSCCCCGGVWGVVSACVVCCFYGRSVDALAPGADEGRGGLR